MSPLATRALIVGTIIGFLWATGATLACLVDIQGFVRHCSEERFLDPGESVDLECCEEKRNGDFFNCVLSAGSNGYDEDYGLCGRGGAPSAGGTLDPVGLGDKLLLTLFYFFSAGARGLFLGCVFAILVSLGGGERGDAEG